MRSEIDLTLELPSSVATLRLAGAVHQADVYAGARVLLALPTDVGTLRIDARDLAELSEPAGTALRLLIKEWRQVRRGPVEILADPPALELLADRRVPTSPPRAVIITGASSANAALTGAFL